VCATTGASDESRVQPDIRDANNQLFYLVAYQDMKKTGFIRGVLVGAVIVTGLLVALFFALPYIYVYSENSNFERLRKKSELDCELMPLHCLVRDENLEEITNYANSGKDMGLRDNWGKTALFWALDREKYPLVSQLLDLNANSNTKDENGISVFHQAVLRGKYDVANQLLASGADIDVFNGTRYPETTLHYCVMKDNVECVRYLVDHGANMYLEDSFGYTVFERIRLHDHISKDIGAILVK
jgi:ankyrin repeat protein